MKREFKTILTPIGKIEIVLKAWLSGREKREITSIYTSNTVYKRGDNDEDKNVTEITGDKLLDAQNKTLEVYIVEVKDGDDKKNNVDKVLDMHSEDFEFILKEIDKSYIPKEQKKD